MSRARWAELALWLTSFGCAVPGILASSGVSPTRVAASVALAFLPYALLLSLADALPAARARQLALLGALSAGLVLALSPPALSDDLYRYLWDGRVLAHGVDPYAHAPSDAALRTLRDELWTRINHRELRTIYPPLAQLVFAGIDGIGHSPAAFKLAMLGAHLLTVGVVANLTSRDVPRATLAYSLNPLALSESALNGHIDVLAGFALSLAVLALSTRRGWVNSLALALAAGTKLIGFLLLPLGARFGWKRTALTALLCLTVLAPMLIPRGTHSSGALHYAQRWEGNTAVFGLLKSGVSLALETLASDEERARGHVRFSALAGPLEQVRGSALDPWAIADAARREVPDRTDFEIPFLAGLATRGLVLCLALGLAVSLALSRLSALGAARFTVLGALLLAPQIHPWYLLWLLPLEAAAGGWCAMAWSVSVLVTYAPLDLWQRARIWNESSLAKLCEFGVVGLVFLLEARLMLIRGEPPESYARLSTLPDRPGT